MPQFFLAVEQCQSTSATSNIPVILWWFTCCRIMRETLRNSVKRDLYPSVEDCIAFLGPVIVFAGEESFFASWGGGLSVKNHQQIGPELPLDKAEPSERGPKRFIGSLEKMVWHHQEGVGLGIIALHLFFFFPQKYKMTTQNFVALGTNWAVPLFGALITISQFFLLVWWNLTCFALDKLIHYALIKNKLYLRILNYFTDINPAGR